MMPEGSNRVFSSLSTNTFSGTPYCKPSEMVSASPSITPESVEPSLAILMKTSPGRPSSYIPTVIYPSCPPTLNLCVTDARSTGIFSRCCRAKSSRCIGSTTTAAACFSSFFPPPALSGCDRFELSR